MFRPLQVPNYGKKEELANASERLDIPAVRDGYYLDDLELACGKEKKQWIARLANDDVRSNFFWKAHLDTGSKSR